MAIPIARDLPLDARSQVRHQIARVIPLNDDEEATLWSPLSLP
jgi:hypothetical protein